MSDLKMFQNPRLPEGACAKCGGTEWERLTDRLVCCVGCRKEGRYTVRVRLEREGNADSRPD